MTSDLNEKITALEAECWNMKMERDRALEWRDHDKEQVIALRAEVERLRAALRNIIAFHEITFVNDKGLEKAVLRTARAALEERT